MNLIVSTWQVSLALAGGGSIILLDTDEYMSSEPLIMPEGQVDIAPQIDAATPFIWGRGNVKITLRFSRVKVCADDAAARAFLVTHCAALPIAIAPQALTIVLLGGGTATLANAVLQSAGQPTTANDRFLAQYTLIGGPLTYAA